MNIIQRALLGCVVAIAYMTPSKAASTAPPSTSLAVLTAQRLSPNVWYFEGESGIASRSNRGFMSNAGFVVTPAGVVVFDALATPVLAQAMIEAIRAVTPRPIRRVIVSHYHADHVYGLQVFKAVGADIWARSEGQHYLVSDVARDRLAQRRQDLSPWVNDQTHLVAADRWLTFSSDEPVSFELGGVRFELLHGGDSHAPGDLMLSIPDEGVLFAGDLFFTGRLPFVVDGNTREWLAALGRLDRSGARIVVPGHGPASLNAAQDLAITRHYLEYLRKTMAHAVEELLSFEEAYAAIDWSMFETLPTFEAANRRNAYSVYLEMQVEMLDRVDTEDTRYVRPETTGASPGLVSAPNPHSSAPDKNMATATKMNPASGFPAPTAIAPRTRAPMP